VRAILCALLMAFVMSLNPAAAQEEPPFINTMNVVYAEVHGVGLVMDIFVPKENANGLGIIDVVSGAWHSDRNKLVDHHMAGMYDIHCARGYVVFAIRPGSVSKFTGEEMLDHIQKGIDFVKRHAGEYKVDPARLGITGASAGGHLATLTVVRAQADAQVAAAAVFFPPTDFLNWKGDGEPVDFDLAKGLFFSGGVAGHSDEEVRASAKALSPALHVKEATPPFLFIHGDADPAVPLCQSEVMVEALKKAGGVASLIVKEGGEHPWPTIREEVVVIADWFDKHLAGK
jgi:acetyl esterase/lipase